MNTLNHSNQKHTFYLSITLIFSLFLTATLYWPGLSGPFFIDDLITLEKFSIESLSFQNLLNAAFAGEPGPLSRPLSMITLALNHYYALDSLGLRAFGFKLVNLILHLITGLSLYYFTKLLMGVFYHKTNNQEIKSALFIKQTAVLTTLFFLIHPLQVSTVLYIIQRMTELSSFFMILGLIGYLWGRQKLLEKKSYSLPIIYISLILGYFFSIASKENGALLAIYLFIIECILYQPKHPENKKLFFILLFFSIIPIILGGVYITLQWEVYKQTYINFGFSVTERLLTQIHALYFYLQQIIIPSLSSMSLYHDDFPVISKLDLFTNILLLGIILLLILSFIIRKKYPIIAFGILWFFASHVIESTILPLELIFEHRNYLALYGIMLSFSYLLNTLYFKATKKYYSTISLLLSFILVLSFSLLTLTRVDIWRDKNLFLELSAYYHPHSLRTNIELANLLLLENNNKQAIKLLTEIQNTVPQNAGPSVQLLFAYCNSHLPNSVFKKTSQLLLTGSIPAYSISALDFLIQKYINQQCSSITPEQILHLINNTIKNPGLEKNNLWQSLLLQLRARTYLLTQDYPLAVLDLKASYELYPKRKDSLIELAYYQIAYGDKREALKTIAKLEYLQNNLLTDLSSHINQLKLELELKNINKNKKIKTKQKGIFEL